MKIQVIDEQGKNIMEMVKMDLNNLEKQLKEIEDAVIVDPIITKKLHDWLGVVGRTTYRGFQEKYNTVIPVIARETYPYSVHFNEGMQVRNFLRGVEECKDWEWSKFEDEYTAYIKAAMIETIPETEHITRMKRWLKSSKSAVSNIFSPKVGKGKC